NSRTRTKRSYVSGQLEGLLFIELRRLGQRLRTLHLHRHTSGTHLEVDGGSTHTDQGGTARRPLRVHAVARGTVGDEELFSFFDVTGGEAVGLGFGLVG